jgi:hypothetical protein
MDYLSLNGGARYLVLTPQQGFSETITTANLELTLDWPIRPYPFFR